MWKCKSPISVVVGGLGSFIVVGTFVGAAEDELVDVFWLDVITGVGVGGVGVSRTIILL